MPNPTQVVITRIRIPADGGAHDVLVEGDRVTSITPAGALTQPPGAAVLDADGRYLVPGLWDEHTHMVQWALAMSRLDLSGAASAGATVALVRAAVADRPLVGYGFRDALWPDAPTTAALDAVSGTTPVILVAADLHCAWVNTAGTQLLGVHTGPDGLVREGEWFAAMEGLDQVTIASAEDALRQALPLLPARGVVGVVDLEWADSIADWSRRLSSAPGLIRVDAGIYPDRLDAAIADGWRSGQQVPGTGGLLRVGPLKILSDGSLNTRTAYCRHQYLGEPVAFDGVGYGHQEFSPDQMDPLVAAATGAGITSTIHAIGDLAVTLALDVFERAGVAGRIEHAQLIDPADLPRFAQLDVVASVQPEHAMDDRDLVDEYWADRAQSCFPLASLRDAGAQLRLGSDAPVAPLDPWISVAAAAFRRRGSRSAWQPREALDVPTALAASARGRNRVRAGDVADLVLVDADPVTADAQLLREMPVWATMLAGRWTHEPA